MKSKITILGLVTIVAAIAYSCETRTYDDISAPTPAVATYNNDIKPLMTNYCTSCHAPGATDPDLTTYDNVKANAESIYNEINSGDMPQGGDKLKDAQIQTFYNWWKNGMPEK